jgi:proteic killer suppression protein
VFGDDALKKLCSTERLQTKQLGADCAKKLRGRLSDLAAAPNVFALPAGKPHPLKGARNGQYAVRLAGGYRLVFEPANVPVPQRPDSSIDWERVTEVRIVYIGDYHDE